MRIVKYYWELVRDRIDGLPLRERMMIFAAAAFAVISLTSTMLLNPILAKQKAVAAQLAQQHEKIQKLQVQIQAALQAKKEDEKSPLRIRLNLLKQQLQAQDDNLQSGRSRMVEPGEMGGMLERLLSKNGKLQLVSLDTLPVSMVTVQTKDINTEQKQIFKHGVRITLRGGYLDLMQYLTAVEKASLQMYWSNVSFNVDKYPDGVLILTLYTLSMDKSWLAV